MANNLFSMLMNGLRNAKNAPPDHSLLAIGFTKQQMLTKNLKKPRLIWYDKSSNTYYDQGDSTKIPKSKWNNINATNFKKDKPMNNLDYYIIMNQTTVAESDKPLK